MPVDSRIQEPSTWDGFGGTVLAIAETMPDGYTKTGLILVACCGFAAGVYLKENKNG